MRVVIPQQWCTWALGPELKQQWCLPTAPMLVSSADTMQWAETPPSAPSFLLLSEFPSAIQMEWNEGREDFHYHWGHNVALNILKTQIWLFFSIFRCKRKTKPKPPNRTKPNHRGVGSLCSILLPRTLQKPGNQSLKVGMQQLTPSTVPTSRADAPGRVSLPRPIQAEKTPAEHRIMLWGQPGIMAPCCFLPTAARIRHARCAPAELRLRNNRYHRLWDACVDDQVLCATFGSCTENPSSPEPLPNPNKSKF